MFGMAKDLPHIVGKCLLDATKVFILNTLNVPLAKNQSGVYRGQLASPRLVLLEYRSKGSSRLLISVPRKKLLADTLRVSEALKSWCPPACEHGLISFQFVGELGEAHAFVEF